jgi:hypothetical protein
MTQTPVSLPYSFGRPCDRIADDGGSDKVLT